MLKSILRVIKAITKQLVVAFFLATFIIFLTMILFGKRITKTVNLVNKLAVVNYVENTNREEIKINKIKKRLVHYPLHGEKFGSVVIPSVNINLKLYQGETLEVLRYGAGHHAGSYFPGEGGTIIIAAHNDYGMFYNLPKVKVGDIVKINTVYGNYEYKVFKTEVANAKKLGDNLKIKTDEEEIMLYTCYPVNTPGFKSNRFVVYGKLVGEEDE